MKKIEYVKALEHFTGDGEARINNLSTVDLRSLVIEGEEPIQLAPVANVGKEEYDSLDEEIKQDYSFDPITELYFTEGTDVWATKWRAHGPYWRNPSDPRYIDFTVTGSEIGVHFDGSELSKSEWFKLYEGQHGDKYRSNLEEYFRKTGVELAEDATMGGNKGKEGLFLKGHVMEAPNMAFFLFNFQKDFPEYAGKTFVYNDTHMYRMGRKDKEGKLAHPWAVFDPDAIGEIDGIRFYQEYKTLSYTSKNRPLVKQGLVPMENYLQCVLGMAILNVPFAIISYMDGCEANSEKYFYIERNFDVENAVLAIGDNFYNCCVNGIEPDTTGQNVQLLEKAYRRKYLQYYTVNPSTVKLDESYLDVIEDLARINSTIKAEEQLIKDLKEERSKVLVERIFPVFREAAFGTCATEDGWYTLKLYNNSRIIIDSEKLKEDEPELYNQFLKKDGKFDSTLFKKQTPEAIWRKFIKGGNQLTEAKSEYIAVEWHDKDEMTKSS